MVILRLRGVDDLGVSVAGIIGGYAGAPPPDPKLIVNGNEVLATQMTQSGLMDRIGTENFIWGRMARPCALPCRRRHPHLDQHRHRRG